ncbi:hypothetical protein RRG08_019179 [Elysia crispata]|uniref:Uncharacterized protein n=1 Tax=Elysia crispata TaxID=231223 RepID=A0AAE0ZW26_9GAST|nr:hypothetical protein RRG08_019179 [Elysia crispata]
MTNFKRGCEAKYFASNSFHPGRDGQGDCVPCLDFRASCRSCLDYLNCVCQVCHIFGSFTISDADFVRTQLTNCIAAWGAWGS